MTILTFIMSLLAFKHYEWGIRTQSLHSMLGFVILILTGVIQITGFITWRLMIMIKWNTHALLKVKSMHQITGYILIFSSQVAILLGVMRYSDNFDVNKRYELGIVHFVTFYCLWAMAEGIY